MTLFSDRINTAISTARSGEREKALAIFREIVEEAPANVQAWLWISELSRNLEDQTRALEYAIKYSSESKETQKDLQAQLYELRGMMGLSAPAEQYNTLFPRQKLEYSKDTQLIDEACQQAQWLEFQGRHEEAIQALQELEKNNLANERVWLLMSDLEPNLAVKIRLLNRVL
jgi:predicted Zn-dependent protease